jgi:hypothetical protein
MTKIAGATVMAVIAAIALTHGVFAQTATGVAPAPQNARECHETGEKLEQMQADIAALRQEVAVMHQMLADMQAAQKPAFHSVADAPGK